MEKAESPQVRNRSFTECIGAAARAQISVFISQYQKLALRMGSTVPAVVQDLVARDHFSLCSLDLLDEWSPQDAYSMTH